MTGCRGIGCVFLVNPVFKTTDTVHFGLLVNLFNLEFPAKGADNSSKKCLWLQMNTHVIVFAKTMNKAKAPRKNFAERNRVLVCQIGQITQNNRPSQIDGSEMSSMP